MKQTREIKQFLFSHYLSDGLRIAFGGLVPAVLFAQFGHLEQGIAFSLGAVTVSIVDSPGPTMHKRNAMLVCTLCMVLSTLLTGLINTHPTLLVVEIAILCFFFSMFNIYGIRAASVGTASLLIMVLTIDQQFTFIQLLKHAGTILGGCTWYMLFSLSVSSIRPYRLSQQSLALSMREVSEYLRLKSKFYDSETDTDDNYRKLISRQVDVHEHQDNTRELLFKSRMALRESTSTGRQLVLVFVDVVDIFEQSMATHYDYDAIKKQFGHTGVLPGFKKIISEVADELENISYYINNNEQPHPLNRFPARLEALKTSIDKIESDHGINTLVLKKILINIRNIVNRIQKIYSYFNSAQLQSTAVRTEDDLKRFVSHQDYDPKLFVDNLSFKSSVFRYSLRVAVVAVAGYLASKLFPLGHHSYWILLTIIVILKPGFSLTKQRNYQRVIGTVIGAAVGVAVLVFIKDQTVKFIFLMIFMICTYTFQRLNYVVSVLFMTPYILIMFSFLGMGNLSTAQERIIDTLVGSVIAFTASYFIFPNWEYHQLKGYMKSLLIANYYYLLKAANLLSGIPDSADYKLVRKDVYVSSANMASAFQRMLSEPKSKQRHSREVHKFVVLNHILSSYTANLLVHLVQANNGLLNNEHIRLSKRALNALALSIKEFKESTSEDFQEAEISLPDKTKLPEDQNPDSQLITEQLEYVNKVAGDIQKLVSTLRQAQGDTQ